MASLRTFLRTTTIFWSISGVSIILLQLLSPYNWNPRAGEWDVTKAMDILTKFYSLGVDYKQYVRHSIPSKYFSDE